VQLERLSVRLRPRGGWEALDLGFHMARTWWKPVWGTWLAVYLPAALLLHVVLNQHLWLAALLLFWLKPAFDRFVLHVVSRAVFGDTPTVRATLAAWRQVLSPGLAAALTVQRFSLVRSFLLAVPQLERQTGRAGRERRAALGRRMRGTGAWLTVVCLHFESFLMLALGAIAVLLVPGGDESLPDFMGLLGGRGEDGAWNWLNSLCYVAAVCIIEPFYVAGGFSLYLNRRAILEGWDIELQLRRMEERLRHALAAVLLAVAAAVFVPAGAEARSAKEEIAEISRLPELNPYRDELQWRLRREERDAPPPATDAGADWSALGKFLADIAQALAWVAAALGVAALAWFAWKHLRVYAAPREEEWRPPEALFGLAVAPASLPADVAGTAASLAQEGRVREALSLLYRGALSVLVHRERVRLVEGDTEGDALRAARGAIKDEAAAYFAELVAAWTTAAYAGRLPDAAAAQALARAWTPHFGAAPA